MTVRLEIVLRRYQTFSKVKRHLIIVSNALLGEISLDIVRHIRVLTKLLKSLMLTGPLVIRIYN